MSSMPTWLRAVLIVVCILLVWWLAVQLGVGMSEDPSLQPPPGGSGTEQPDAP